MSYQGSQVFYPYRTVGLYSGNAPFALTKVGTVHFATVPIQNTFQVFSCDKLKVVAVGEQFESSVKVVAIHTQLQTTFVAVGCDIHVCIRNRKASTLQGHTGKISLLLVLGKYLLSYSNDDKLIKLWDFAVGEETGSFELPEYYDVSVIMHPDTYLNKIIIGTKQGPIYLWNIRSQKLIHTFDGWESPVCTIVQSPAVDVVAVGLMDGRIIMHNLKLDKTLFTFRQTGMVSGISFRTDGHNFMVSATEVGNLAVWDLDKRALVTQFQNAHNGIITSLQFFEREPLLLTTGQDNSIKVWIFDQLSGGPRLLRQRGGHSKPPTKLAFWLRSGSLISAAQDGALRYFVLTKDQQSREFSQGALESISKKTQREIEDLRLPPITQFAATPMKLGNWDNVVTCHRGSKLARSWNVDKYILGIHKFASTCPEETLISAVATTVCGNFAIIGAKSGWIDQYNLQSGMHRGKFVGPERHKREITGLEVTQLNNVLISSSLDGTIKFWDLQLHTLLHTLDLAMPVTTIRLNKESNLLAAVGDDFNVRIFDCSTRKLVRIFKGHQTAISDIAFSNTARWLVTASGMDREVRLWDVPSGRCIDWFLTHSPITSLSISPNGDFLATSHAGERAIYIWANAMYFSNVFLKPLPPKPTLITLPKIGASNKEEESDEEDGMDLADGFEENKMQLSPDLITFSGQPKSILNTLVNLEKIKERNKSKVAPEAPKEAPFLLSTAITAPGRAPIFNPPAEKEDIQNTPTSRIVDFSKLRPKTKFVALLETANYNQNYLPVMNFLKSVSPSAVDFELRSLSLENDGEELKLTLLFFKHELEHNTNFELIQAYLNVFYKAHWEFIQDNENLQKLIKEINVVHQKKWKEMLALFDSNLCLLGYFADAFST